MSQDDDHEQALEVAAATVHIDHTIEVRRARDFARTAVTAYLSAMPQRELRIGDFILRHSPNGIWIGRTDGEGGEFATEHVERVIAQFYRENF